MAVHLSRLRRVGAVAGTVALAAFLVLFSGSGTASAWVHPHPGKLAQAQAQAAARLRAAGVTWTSSGGCTARGNPSCTSLEQINRSTVRGVVTLRWASGCAITITGGTEVGHGPHTRHSHYNGYKVDIKHSRCIDRYLHRYFTYVGLRGDGFRQWRARSGNMYCDEGSHWDITYLTCCC
jgi:hypothetical protein